MSRAQINVILYTILSVTEHFAISSIYHGSAAPFLFCMFTLLVPVQPLEKNPNVPRVRTNHHSPVGHHGSCQIERRSRSRHFLRKIYYVLFMPSQSRLLQRSIAETTCRSTDDSRRKHEHPAVGDNKQWPFDDQIADARTGLHDVRSLPLRSASAAVSTLNAGYRREELKVVV